MSTLDPEGRLRLAALQERSGHDRFQEVGPTTGTDTETGLILTVDAARRVEDVRVPDAALVRTPGLLRAAVRAAYQDADLARARASRESAGRRPPDGERIDVTALLRPPPPAPRGVAGRTRASVASGVPAARRSALSGTGRSDNGYLAVRLGPTGVVEDVETDAEWLAAAREQYLETALVQAFAQAARTPARTMTGENR